MKEKSKKRNNAIDFFRGLIAIHIIMIHTVFHSGNLYVPYKIQSWVLLFDVPIFLILSGMTFAFHESPGKKLQEIAKVMFKWLIFICFCYVYLYFVDRQSLHIKDFTSWLVFNPHTNSAYTLGVSYSLWFMLPFIESSIICSILIYFTVQGCKNDNEKIVRILLLLLLFGVFLLVAGYSKIYFGMSLNTIYYCIFYLLGYLSMKCKFTNIKSFIFVEAIVISLFIIALHYNNLQIADLQILKSEGSYIYVLASLISCLLVIYLKDKIKCDSLIFKPINFIGKNALYLFFSQGLSSSLMFLIVPKINIANVYLKIILMFLINLGISLTFFIILMLVYKLVDIIINKLKKVGWLRLENFIISNDK